MTVEMGAFVFLYTLSSPFVGRYSALRSALEVRRLRRQRLWGTMNLGIEGNPEKGQVIAKHPFLLTDHACVGVDGGRGQHDVKILWGNLRKNVIGGFQARTQ